MKIRWFMLIGIIFSFIVILGSLFLFGPDLFQDDVAMEILLSYTILGIFPLLWFYWQFKKQAKSFGHVISFQGIGRYFNDVVFITLALIVFSLGAFWVLGYMLSFPLPQYVQWLLSVEDVMPSHTLMLLLMSIYISFIGPIVEEFIFRGLLLKRLGKKVNMTFSIIVTNILFGLLHMDLLGAFIFGFIASLLYLHSGNLLVPILVHVLNNLLVTIFMFINLPLPDFLTYETISQLRAHVVPNVLILVITVPVLFAYIRKYISALKRVKIH